MAARGQQSGTFGAAARPGGRLVVKRTFLDFEEPDDEQPAVLPRSRTDSVLWTLQRTIPPEYRPGTPSTDDTPPTSDAECHEDLSEVVVAECSRVPEGHRAERSGASSSQRRPEHEEHRTTLMLRNVPNDYTRTMLLDLFAEKGFARAYDFVYLPVDFERGCGLGYAFVNLVDSALVPAFRAAFEGHSRWSVRSNKVCQVSWSDRDQGLRANVRRYRNSPVMHASVPDEYKPCLYSGGERVPFPTSKKQLRPPTMKRA